jgi:hypothetical protein
MLAAAGVRMTIYILRAVSREPEGQASDIADTWPLNATSLEDAKAEVDRQAWGEPTDIANAFEIVDSAGNVLTWRPFHKGGEAGLDARSSAEWSAVPSAGR